METIQEIKKISEDYIQAINKRDIRKILYLYDKNPKFIPYYGDIMKFGPVIHHRWTHGYLQNHWQKVFNITGAGFKYIQSTKEIQIIGEIVYEIGMYDLRMSNRENEKEEGTYFILWKRDFNTWKIAVHIYNSLSRPKWGEDETNTPV